MGWKPRPDIGAEGEEVGGGISLLRIIMYKKLRCNVVQSEDVI